jgi:hypothetical protein
MNAVLYWMSHKPGAVGERLFYNVRENAKRDKLLHTACVSLKYWNCCLGGAVAVLCSLHNQQQKIRRCCHADITTKVNKIAQRGKAVVKASRTQQERGISKRNTSVFAVMSMWQHHCNYAVYNAVCSAATVGPGLKMSAFETGDTWFATTSTSLQFSRILPNNRVLLWRRSYGTPCILKFPDDELWSFVVSVN